MESQNAGGNQTLYAGENQTKYIENQSSGTFTYANKANASACNTTSYNLPNLNISTLQCFCTPESAAREVCRDVAKIGQECHDVPKNETITRYLAITKNRTVTKYKTERGYRTVEEAC